MNISKYTFLFKGENNDYYAYNTLSNALIGLEKEIYDILSSVVSHESTSLLLSLNNIDKDNLLNHKILTNSEEDDFLLYKSIIYNQRQQTNSMHITIAPTMDCCFKCYYCFENNKNNHYITEQTIDSILLYIENRGRNIDVLNITWFGGEPLLAIDKIDYFYNALNEKGIQTKICSNIITTGYHLDLNAITILKRHGIANVQITLDGLEKTHNKVKFLPNGDNVFKKVISNIHIALKSFPQIKILLRVNLTLDNYFEFKPLLNYILNEYSCSKSINVNPSFVLDRDSINSVGCCTNNCFSHKKRSEYILELSKNGVLTSYVDYPSSFFNECAIRNDMAIVFDSDGLAYKCWEIIGNKKYSIGKLDSTGHLIDINLAILNRQLYGADPIEDNTCRECKYLPICNGGCPIQRIENKYEGKNNVNCTYYKGYMKDFLNSYLRFANIKK